MLKQIFDLLHQDEYYGVSEEIEIAKGKYKAPQTWKEVKKQFKRRLQWQLKRQ